MLRGRIWEREEVCVSFRAPGRFVRERRRVLVDGQVDEMSLRGGVRRREREGGWEGD